MEDLKVMALQMLFSQQQEQIGHLSKVSCLLAQQSIFFRSQIDEVRVELQAVCKCLEASGILTKVAPRCPAPPSLFGEVLKVHGAARAITSAAGVSAELNLCTASRSCMEALSQMFLSLMTVQTPLALSKLVPGLVAQEAASLLSPEEAASLLSEFAPDSDAAEGAKQLVAASGQRKPPPSSSREVPRSSPPEAAHAAAGAEKAAAASGLPGARHDTAPQAADAVAGAEPAAAAGGRKKPPSSTSRKGPRSSSPEAADAVVGVEQAAAAGGRRKPPPSSSREVPRSSSPEDVLVPAMGPDSVRNLDVASSAAHGRLQDDTTLKSFGKRRDESLGPKQTGAAETLAQALKHRSGCFSVRSRTSDGPRPRSRRSTPRETLPYEAEAVGEADAAGASTPAQLSSSSSSRSSSSLSSSISSVVEVSRIGATAEKLVQHSASIGRPCHAAAGAPTPEEEVAAVPADAAVPAEGVKGTGPKEPMLYVCGGHDGVSVLNSVEAFDTVSGTWMVQPTMRTSRCSATPVTIDGRLYMCGGSEDQNGSQGICSVEAYDPSKKEWLSLPPMLQRRTDFAALALGGCLYACGGRLEDGRASRDVERFDPHAWRWEAQRSMAEARYNMGAVALDECLYLCGGEGDGPSSHDAQDGWPTSRWAERLCVRTQECKTLPPMFEGRCNPMIAASNGCVYIFGGILDKQELCSLERFDPAVGEWQQLPHMAHPHWRASMGVDRAGRILVCGGLNGSKSLNSVERFDPKREQWEEMQVMNCRRSSASCSVMGDNFYICGGKGIQGPLRTVERFDMLEERWCRLAPMLRRHCSASGQTLWH